MGLGATRARGREGAVLLVMLVGGGCFGDWVSARPRPRSDVEISPTAETGTPTPSDPCGAYVTAVAARCDGVLDGHFLTPGCHAEIVRVMALYHHGEVPFGHQPRSPGREPSASSEPSEDTCAQHLRALPPTEPARTDGPALGPHCRAWAQAVRERCVAPLATMPPDLRGCGPELPAFESTLGAITFGRPSDYEDQCRDAVTRLRKAEPG